MRILTCSLCCLVFSAMAAADQPAQDQPGNDLPPNVLSKAGFESSNEEASETIQNSGFESETGTGAPISDNPSVDSGSKASVEDECDWNLRGQPVQEQSQEVVRSWSCHSFRWFDGLFGHEEDYPENEISGLVLLGFEWREYDGFDPRGRFRVRHS